MVGWADRRDLRNGPGKTPRSIQSEGEVPLGSLEDRKQSPIVGLAGCGDAVAGRGGVLRRMGIMMMMILVVGRTRRIV